MITELRRGVQILKQFKSTDGHPYAALETNRDCNRGCSYCAVPSKYRREQELTVDETKLHIDWLYDQGIRLLSYLGGEPCAPFQTKEGISFLEHTLQVVNHASEKGMMVNITTNGDYVTPDVVRTLKHAGLHAISLSLHSFTNPGLRHIIEGGRMAAQEGIIPIITTVFTTKNADQIPGIAAHIAENGIIYGFGLVQEKGGGFSKSQEESLIPTVNQQKEVFGALLRLKTFGFIRNNRNYMTRALDHYPNNWTCDPERDAFIHIGAGGTVDVCSDVRTNLTIADIPTLSNDRGWRDVKRALVRSCGNCLYQCYFESQHPNISGDVPLYGVGLMIRSGNAHLAERWGQFAVNMCKKMTKNVDWNLKLK